MQYNGSYITQFGWAVQSGIYAITTSDELDVDPSDGYRVKIGFARGNNMSRGLATRLSNYSTAFPDDKDAIGRGFRILMVTTTPSAHGNVDSGDAANIIETECKQYLKSEGYTPQFHASGRESEWFRITDIDVLRDLIEHLLDRSKKGFNEKTNGAKPQLEQAYYFGPVKFNMPDGGDQAIAEHLVYSRSIAQEEFDVPVQLDKKQERNLRRLINAYTRDDSEENKEELEDFLHEVYGERKDADEYIETYKNVPLPTNPTHEERLGQFINYVQPDNDFRHVRTSYMTQSQRDALKRQRDIRLKRGQDAFKALQYDQVSEKAVLYDQLIASGGPPRYNQDVVVSNQSILDKAKNFFNIF